MSTAADGPAESEITLQAAVELFNAGRYLASHELFEELWNGTEGADSDFYKGLVQAAVALHHFQAGNLAGAARLYGGHRRCLAGYLPTHSGLDVAAFLRGMQACFSPLLGQASGVAFEPERRPRLSFVAAEQ